VSFFTTRQRCPACDCPERSVFLDLPYDSGQVYEHLVDKYQKRMGKFEPACVQGERYMIAECKSCDLLYQVQLPTAEMLTKVYSEWIDYDAARRRDEEKRGGKINQYNYEFALLNKWAKGKKLKVFDYGMGHGRWLEVAYVHGHTGYGYEYDAHRHYKANSLYTVLSLEEIDQHQFDFINTEQVFEHLSHPAETLHMLAKALKPGGMLRISVPEGITMRGKIKQDMRLDFSPYAKIPMGPLVPLQHLNCYAGRSMQIMASRAGLQPFYLPLGWLIGCKADWSTPKAVMLNVLQPLKMQLLHKKVSPMRYFVKPH
jgi:transcription elongation factor Elf1